MGARRRLPRRGVGGRPEQLGLRGESAVWCDSTGLAADGVVGWRRHDGAMLRFLRLPL